MSRRHTEAQMIAALKQVEAGRAVEDVAREVAVSKHAIYGWKAKYGGMEVSQAQDRRNDPPSPELSTRCYFVGRETPFCFSKL